MLEQPKKSGGKLVSHILASHGGESKFSVEAFIPRFIINPMFYFDCIFSGDIFIHCLANYRTPMEDPPSISEGCGGRVTDYRINVSWKRVLL